MTYNQFIEMIDIISLNGDIISNEKIAEMIGASVEDVSIERVDIERYME